jgi:hypothetical protein
MNTSLSIFARALATENLSFSFDSNATTASFDVKNRHLVMPVWDVSETLQTMLVAHEIAHALWTPYEQSERLFKEAEQEGYNPEILHRICNTIEDVRIEKLMKKKYPGTRRDFFLGYREIVEKGLFNLASIDWSKTDMISRLNAHFKWGVPGFLTVPLKNQDEAEVATLIDRVETFEEAFALAKAIYGMPDMQASIQKILEKQNAMGGEGTEEGEVTPSKGIGEDLAGSLKRKEGEECNSINLTVSRHTNTAYTVITTDSLIRTFQRCHHESALEDVKETYRNFVKQSEAFVSQLAAQFDRRKAADEIRRERPKQTGMLNLDRLHQFRTHDDIFLSKIIKQDGKNHGIMFIMDLSGSMGSTLSNCYLQVLQLVWFCEKAKIPFEVYGFTDTDHPDYANAYQDERKEYNRKHGSTDPYLENFVPSFLPHAKTNTPDTITIGDTRLVQFATSRDSKDKRESLLAMLYGSICMGNLCRPFRMGGTPTVEAINLISEHMERFVVENNIQIPTLMVVTDGCPNGVSTKGNFNNMILNDNGVVTVRNDIFGTVHRMNGKDYTGLDLPNIVIGSMVDAMKQKLNARIVGMYVGGQNLCERTFMQFCCTRNEMAELYRSGSYTSIDSPRGQAAKKAYSEGALVVHPSVYPGFDAFFLTRTPRIVADADALKADGTFTKIRNNFVKTMGKRGCSRVFLSKYVDIVAGQPVRASDDPLYKLPLKG